MMIKLVITIIETMTKIIFLSIICIIEDVCNKINRKFSNVKRNKC